MSKYFIAFFLLLCGVLYLPSHGEAKDKKKHEPGKTNCTMQFHIKSWSVFYKSGKGAGTIKCDNGQKADVYLRSHGGGITFGKENIADASGEFSPVADIKDLYGKYGTVGGEGGAVKSRIGYTMSKDDIDLNIKGTGTGGGFGFDFSGFRISPLTEKQRQEIKKEEAKQAAKDAKGK